VIDAGGGSTLLRTNSRSVGVMTLDPKAVRLVSMVFALWTMRLSASFHLAYSGSGLAAGAAAAPPAAGAADWATALPMPPRPARATTPPLDASMRRRLRFVVSFMT